MTAPAGALEAMAPPPRGTLALLWLGLFALLLCTAYGNIENDDARVTMQAARALWLRGDSGLRRSVDRPDWEAEAIVADYIADSENTRDPKYGKKGKDTELRYVWFPMGHLWLLVPAVAAGEALGRLFPQVEQRYRQLAPIHYPYGMFVFDQAVVTMVLPAACGATLGCLLLAIALAFGCTRRQGALCAAAILFGTQCFPLGRETLSDGPGMCFLLAALLVAVRAHLGTADARLLVVGGACAGAAVLTRYPHGTLVPVLAAVIALAGCRRGRRRDLLWFVLGGLPFAVALLLVDHARYGDVFDTGYPKADSWFTYPIWFGLPKLLIAAGKGILWFSPLLWLALPLAARRRHVPQLRWLAWVLFAVPMLMFSATNGWQSGQCWGARYVSPAVIALLALVLPQARPWQRRPRTFALLAAAGLLVNVTSMLAPIRGYDQLAGQAVRAMYAEQRARGQITQQDLDALDEADHFSFLPRFSPLHGHWHYAWRSSTGGFEDERQLPRNGVANTIEPLFGISSSDPAHGLAPIHWEDRGGRHLWFVFWGQLLAVAWWALLLPPVLAAAALLWAGWRRLSRN